MPYNLRNFDGRAFTTIEDGVVDRQGSSSLYLIGKDVTGYGTFQNDNFLWLLENFAGTIEPASKVQGQIWFDKNVGVLKPKIYDGFEWKMFAMLTASGTAPLNANPGDIWYDTVNDQLSVKSSSSFTLIGPEKVSGFDTTRIISISVLDTAENPHACMLLYVDGTIVGVISLDEFDVFSQEDIYAEGITSVGKGLTLVSGATVDTDTLYASQSVNETVTGVWNFSSGFNVGSNRIVNTGTNLLIAAPAKDILIDAAAVVPFGTTNLGSSSNRYNKVFVSEVSGGTSISGVTLTGQFSLSSSSKLFPSADGTISLGAGNARWSTVFTRALNAGTSDSTAAIVGNWALEANSIIDATAGTFKTDTLSTGDAVNPGSITGAWSLTNDSSITFDSGTLDLGTGKLDVTSGSLQSRTLSAGTESTQGTVTGQWRLSTNSQFDASAGTLKSDTLTTGNAATSGSITGAWALSSNSSIDTRLGTLYSSSLSAGENISAGTVTGNWALSANSQFDASAGTLRVGAITGNLSLSNNDSFDVRLGTLYSKSLNAGSATTTSTITGNWIASAGSTFDATAGTLRSRTLSTGNSATTGTITGAWTLTSGSRLQATYADIAEKYTSDIIYESGTVVMFGGSHEVTAAFGSQSTKVAGIVTTEPAQVLNVDAAHAVAIALVGRVPCKVVGKIEKGDLLVTSHIPGVATNTSFPRTGALIAKALEDYDSIEVGTIEVMVVRG
jgi:hypothetical protein